MAAKRLELLRELLPGVIRIAVLVDPANARTTESTLKELEAAVRTIGLQMEVINASTSPQIDAAFATLVSKRPDALFVGIPSCSAAVSNWCNWRRAMRFPPYIKTANMPRSAD